MRDEDSYVANDRDAALVRRRAHPRPLAVEEELHVALKLDAIGQPFACSRERIGLTTGELLLPIHPGDAAVSLFERGKEGIVVEPALLCRAECLVVVVNGRISL